MNPIREAVEYGALRAALGVFSARDPLGVVSRGALLGRLIRKLGVRERVLQENLARAFPDMPQAARDKILDGPLAHFGRMLVEAWNIPRWTPDEWRARVTIHRWDIVENLRSQGRGVVVLVGHFGAFDVGGGRLSLDGHKVMSVYQPLHNRLVQRDILRIRSLHGGRVADARMGLREVLRFLRDRGVVFMLSDEDTGTKGAFVPFFGHLASSHRGPVEVARRSGAAIVTGFVGAETDGTYLGGFEDEIPVTTDEEVLTEYHRRLEAHIRARPSQYFWLHKRWKTKPPA